MELNIYQVDAFAETVFTGNPAAVVPLESWLDDSVMQAIAAENNLAETAFFIAKENDFEIRWFTPLAEVDLCGHATLASAYVLFSERAHPAKEIVFHSKSGPLAVTKTRRNSPGNRDLNEQRELLVLNFPSLPPQPCDVPAGLSEALGITIKNCLVNGIYVVVLEDEKQVLSLQPDYNLLLETGCRGVTVTATSEQYDFVNRYFAPLIGINEDSVTGSAYARLIPYWAARLAKTTLSAKQVSQRGGDVHCELIGDRVTIGGTAVKYLQGVISI